MLAKISLNEMAMLGVEAELRKKTIIWSYIDLISQKEWLTQGISLIQGNCQVILFSKCYKQGK